MDASRSLEKKEYNEAAVRTAASLESARSEIFQSFKGREIKPDRLFRFDRTGLGVAREYERMGNRPVSQALQERADRLGFTLEHIGLTIGSVVHGIDLRGGPDEESIRFVRDTLLERKVVFFREQPLEEDELLAFGRCFGELDAFPFGQTGEDPFILEIRHDERYPGYENGWHTDVTWMECPSLGSIAQCIEIPPIGGDTLFSDSHACYLGLPVDLRDRLQHLHGINDYRNFLVAPAPGLPTELIERIKAEIPFGVHHPLLRTHPETGKTALYLHGGFLRHDSLYDERTGEALEKSEAEEIVRRLLQQHQRPEYVCRFRWEPGSIAFWDNRAVQHYAASDYYPHRRILRRVTVSGDRPYYDPPPQEQALL